MKQRRTRKEEFLSPPNSDGNYSPALKTSSSCAKTYFKTAWCYPEEVWNEELDELRQRLNKWNANHQLIFRQFVSDVEIITMDGNGRILIPKRYLQITGIQSDVRFIGVDNKIEIWAKERAEKLFMEPEAFGAALEEIMKEERRTTNNELK